MTTRTAEARRHLLMLRYIAPADERRKEISDTFRAGTGAKLRHGIEKPDLKTTAVPGDSSILGRLTKIESQNRRLRLVLLAVILLVAYLGFMQLFPDSVIVKQTLLESEEVKLIDKSGATRLFLRMYSRVPVLQIIDSKGKPRMSIGLRFDDTPFIDLSDHTGKTRATFEMTEDDEPTLRLFDANGETSFAIN